MLGDMKTGLLWSGMGEVVACRCRGILNLACSIAKGNDRWKCGFGGRFDRGPTLIEGGDYGHVVGFEMVFCVEM